LWKLLFSNEEIDNIIKHMPNDKAPGPDGFNGLFMKKILEYYEAPVLQYVQQIL
jgi:hypothetical protein